MEVYTTEVIGNERYSEKDFLIRLAKPRGFMFEAGQFVMVHVNNEKRAFSVASPPSYDFLELLIKKHSTGKVSSVLYKLKEGDKVNISGPYGKFRIKRIGNKEIIFVAGGTGLAPFRGMIYSALEKNPNKKITLIFGLRRSLKN